MCVTHQLDRILITVTSIQMSPGTCPCLGVSALPSVLLDTGAIIRE